MEPFDLPKFLSFFPQFDTTEYPKPKVQSCGFRAKLHITKYIAGMPLEGEHREYAQFLMAAHLLVLDAQDADNGGAGSVAGTPFKATIGSVAIEGTKPNSFQSDDWNYWLNQTVHGRELLAFLDSHCQGIYLATLDDSVRDLP